MQDEQLLVDHPHRRFHHRQPVCADPHDICGPVQVVDEVVELEGWNDGAVQDVQQARTEVHQCVLSVLQGLNQRDGLLEQLLVGGTLVRTKHVQYPTSDFSVQ
jgi:hypothetical protein